MNPAARGRAVTSVEHPGQCRPRDPAGVVVEGDQGIELVACERHGHGAQHLGLVAGEVGAEEPEGLGEARVEIGQHAARHPGRVGRARGRGMADAEGPDALHVEIGSRHDAFVPDEGEKPRSVVCMGGVFRKGREGSPPSSPHLHQRDRGDRAEPVEVPGDVEPVGVEAHRHVELEAGGDEHAGARARPRR